MGRIFTIAAGLAGAAGIALAAAGAHAAGGNSTTAGTFLLIHAAAFLALGRNPPAARSLLSLAAAVLGLGVIVFAGDLAARDHLGSRLFPFAAPLGGTLMIAGWVGVALAGLVGRR